MKEIILNEDELKNIKSYGEQLFVNTDVNDPTSLYYNRHLERPKISWTTILLNILFTSIAFILFYSWLYFHMHFPYSLLLSLFILLLYLLINLKKIFICAVHIYQHYAPTSLRMKCRFEPSCSQYMIAAIEKYGAIKGLIIGIKRLKRCKVGNGGYDFL